LGDRRGGRRAVDREAEAGGGAGQEVAVARGEHRRQRVPAHRQLRGRGGVGGRGHAAHVGQGAGAQGVAAVLERHRPGRLGAHHAGGDGGGERYRVAEGRRRGRRRLGDPGRGRGGADRVAERGGGRAAGEVRVIARAVHGGDGVAAAAQLGAGGGQRGRGL